MRYGSFLRMRLNLYALFRAIDDLENILRLAPDLDAAFELRDLIDRRLAPLLDPASTYLFDNMLKLSVRCGETVDRLQAQYLQSKLPSKQSLPKI